VRRAALLPLALDDPEAIFDFIVERSDSVAVGRAFVARLRARCDELAALPGTLGRDRSELVPGMRSTVYRGYLIFFVYRGGRFEVVRIIEGHRDIVAQFGDA